MTKEAQIPIKPEDRDLSGIIEVLKANIKERESKFLCPDLCLTKGEMTFLVEILEQKEKNGLS